eukprot:TRINITY_DN7716_c0_g1_i1.p2 TRINITY_DN7716_c0_g1~~TRINITY_DN7716_c0_g1_i1.p2  ORF type:complete len:205 (+),score=138.09 TRINITY_DN7716_c0_g1_i1:69-683(+)
MGDVSIEQMYPRSKGDYENYANAIFHVMRKNTYEHKDPNISKKKAGVSMVNVLNACLDEALSEAHPEEIKELQKAVDEVCNKKIEAHNKEIGKQKSKLKGCKVHMDGNAADFDKLEREEDEKVDLDQLAKEKAEEEDRERRDADAQAALRRKEEERKALQEQLNKGKAARKVEPVDMSGFKMMSKKDDDMGFGGFGGKKKGKKK